MFLFVACTLTSLPLFVNLALPFVVPACLVLIGVLLWSFANLLLALILLYKLCIFFYCFTGLVSLHQEESFSGLPDHSNFATVWYQGLTSHMVRTFGLSWAKDFHKVWALYSCMVVAEYYPTWPRSGVWEKEPSLITRCCAHPLHFSSTTGTESKIESIIMPYFKSCIPLSSLQCCFIHGVIPLPHAASLKALPIRLARALLLPRRHEVQLISCQKMFVFKA